MKLRKNDVVVIITGPLDKVTGELGVVEEAAQYQPNHEVEYFCHMCEMTHLGFFDITELERIGRL